MIQAPDIIADGRRTTIVTYKTMSDVSIYTGSFHHLFTLSKDMIHFTEATRLK